jgi:hypothetical protein
MRAPSQKALLERFRDLTPEDAKLIRTLAKAVDEDIPGHFADPLRDLVEDHTPDTAKYVRSMSTRTQRRSSIVGGTTRSTSGAGATSLSGTRTGGRHEG